MSPEQKIGHYRILCKLGEGGMGEVWRAADTKLNRDVAIKILPNAFANDPSRMARFTREAQVLASLNHPNIAAIYGVEDQVLVMELVEGPTLAECISRGPMELEEVLKVMGQLVDALEYAHQFDVVHRDVKPANLILDDHGNLWVADFGLVRLRNDSDLTCTGELLGTGLHTELHQQLGSEFDALDELLRGISAVGELTPRTSDYVVSFGERLSSMIATEGFIARGIAATLVDPRQVIVTDAQHTRALPQVDEINDRLQDSVKPLIR